MQKQALIDKSSWPKGEWNNEPDREEWIDSYSGYKCEIIRHEHLGSLCGYVTITFGHPYFRKKYNEIDIDVHGGLTYGTSHKNLLTWVLGFDCAHLNDVCPGMPIFAGEIEYKTYKSWDYVKDQVVYLAHQLKSVEKKAV